MVIMLGALFALAPSAALSVPLHDFADLTVWSANADGGNAPSVSQGAAPGGMRLKYTDRAPQWGNLSGPCRVPAGATALRVRFTKHHGDGFAAMHIWLFEPDGDAWVQALTANGTPYGALRPGSHVAALPVSGFSFDPRGRKTREMTTVNRMLIGCNYADLEVTMTSMDWETRAGSVTAPLPRTQGLKIEPGRRGRVAVLDMGAKLPDGFVSGHPTARMVAVLRKLGFGVTVLRAGDMADRAVLDARKLDVVVMTNGPYFPSACRESFLAYLRVGGSLLTTDGYAFDRLVEWDGQGWAASTRTADQMAQDAGPSSPMNTRTGKPGDAMTFAPEQIGLFDPQYKLEHVERVDYSACWGSELRTTFPVKRAITGYSACALIGDNNPVFPPVYRRWMPVIDALGRDLEPRGTLLAIAHNVDGAYKGSSWAFSGLTSGHDLLLTTPGRQALLGRVMDTIIRKAYAHDLSTEYASYTSGEKVTATFTVTNFGRRAARMKLVLKTSGQAERAYSVDLKPGEIRPMRADFTASGGHRGLVDLRLREMADGRAVDALGAGYCVRDPGAPPDGPRIAWNGSYLTVDGRPTFLTGTNQTGMVFYSKHESPAVWNRDLLEMARHNVHIVRILHFSPYAARGYDGQAGHSPVELANRPERLRRQLDAIVQLAGRHRVALFLSVHDWQGVALTDAELAAQADWNRFWANRYKDCPWVFFDVQNEPAVDVPDRQDIRSIWNAWLQERYGSDDALREAWGPRAPAEVMPNVPIAPASNDWDDVRAADRKRFEAVLLNRWVKANVDGLKAGNPNAPVTVGYLPSMPPADKMLGTAYVDFSNMHFYGSVETFPYEFKLTDRRFEGKGFSVGEFGAQEAHQARNQGSDTAPVKISADRFRTMLHYAASMGAAFACNWCWKEFDEAVFPWGLVQRGDGATRPWLETYSQGSLFLSFLEPAPASPSVYLLAPDRHRIGPKFDEIHGALQRTVELLLDSRVNFGVINEESLDRLPISARTLVWPIPYCPDDATFDRVLAWVRAGGRLYLSGDVQFDAWRRPARAQRLAALGLPDRAPHGPFEEPDSRWSAEPMTRAVGNGLVFYVPYPLELRHRVSDGGIYARFLAEAGAAQIALDSTTGTIRAQSIPLMNGGTLTLVTRARQEGDASTVRLPGLEAELTLADGDSVLLVTSRDGTLTAAETSRRIVLRDLTLAESDGQFGLIALDGRDLRESAEVLVLPHLQSKVRVAGLRGVVGGTARHRCPVVGQSHFRGITPELTFAYGDYAVLAKDQAAAKRAWEKVQKRLELR